MKGFRRGFLSVLIGGSLLLTFANSSLAVPIIINVDETGQGFFTIDGKRVPKGTDKGALAKDPIDNKTALVYNLPAQVMAHDGDLIVPSTNDEGNVPSDVIRFQGNKLYFFSDLHQPIFPREPAAPSADQGTIGLTLNAPGRDTVSIAEGKDDANNGVMYQPRLATQPGTAANDLMVYNIKSEGNGGKELDTPPPVKSMGRSVAFDSSQGKLTFSNDAVTDTGCPGDSLVGAAVNLPAFLLVGPPVNGDFFFDSGALDLFSLSVGSSVFLQAHLSMLTYSSANNTFRGLLTGLSLDTTLGSIWIDDAATYFDPESPLFQGDGSLRFFFTYEPDDNMLGLTQSFSVSGESCGTNGIIGAVVPEPSTFCLLGAGLFSAIGAWARRKRTRSQAAR